MLTNFRIKACSSVGYERVPDKRKVSSSSLLKLIFLFVLY